MLINKNTERDLNWFLKILAGDNYRFMGLNDKVSPSKIEEAVQALAQELDPKDHRYQRTSWEAFKENRVHWLILISTFCIEIKEQKAAEKIKQKHQDISYLVAVINGASYGKIAKHAGLSSTRIEQVVAKTAREVRGYLQRVQGPEYEVLCGIEGTAKQLRDFKTQWLTGIAIYQRHYL